MKDQNRRDFLKTAGVVAAASCLPLNLVELAFADRFGETDALANDAADRADLGRDCKIADLGVSLGQVRRIHRDDVLNLFNLSISVFDDT